MPDLRAVVPAVLLGEAATPADTADQNESSVNGQGTPPPEAADSENGDSAPGERSLQCDARFSLAPYINTMHLYMRNVCTVSTFTVQRCHTHFSDSALLPQTEDHVVKLLVGILLIISNAMSSSTCCR